MGAAAARRAPHRARAEALRTVPAALGRIVTTDRLVVVGVAGALCALAFGAQGGVAIEPLTWAEVGLLLAGSALGAAALAAPARWMPVQRFHGAAPLAALAALTVLTALSVVWSLAPADSWLDANRMLAYLAAFGGGMGLARLAPGRWNAVLGGLLLGCVVVCGWALLTKVLPASLAETELFARLRAPFGYWNAVGLMAALGVPPALWLAARRSGHAALNALGVPAMGLLLVCLMLSYSRGALLALLAGLVAWFVLVPLRLRSAMALLSSAAGAAVVVAWAFGQDGLTVDRIALQARTDDGHELGVLLALMTVVLLAVGLATGFLSTYRPPSPRLRLLAGRVLVGALVAAVLASVVALALAPGGIDGQVSKAWNQLTDPNARTPANSPDRLTATSSVRARYWDEALDVHADAPWVGAGAAAYATARKRYRTSDLDVQHAHGYFVQTLADLGWVGLFISLAAIAAWLAAAVAVLGMRRRDRGLPWDGERVGLCALATVVVVFAVHSAVDWTWYVPATAVAMLLSAGWVAARPPLRARLSGAGSEGAAHAGLPLGARLRAWRPDPYRTVLAAAVLITAMAAAWTVLQPLRSIHAGDAAIARLQTGAYDAAADIARIGAERNPLSVEPLFELAAIQAAAGRLDEAHEALEEAVKLQPANAEAWRRLGRFRLRAMQDVEGARKAFAAALYLDPHSPDSQSDMIEATRALQAAPPAEATP